MNSLKDESLDWARRGRRILAYSTSFALAALMRQEARDVARPANTAVVFLLLGIIMFSCCEYDTVGSSFFWIIVTTP